jgi:uncharacterized protein YneF (UPF0154 family)
MHGPLNIKNAENIRALYNQLGLKISQQALYH